MRVRTSEYSIDVVSFLDRQRDQRAGPGLRLGSDGGITVAMIGPVIVARQLDIGSGPMTVDAGQ